MMVAAWGVMPAATVSESEAMAIARQFMQHNSAMKAPGTSASVRLELAHTAIDKHGNVDYYAFNRANTDGFILVTGDDNLIPVLGYTESGRFDIATMPDNMQWWLGECQREIEYLKQHPDQARKAPAAGKSVRPLLTCNWNQSAPYNNNCPVYNGSRCVTGCVATATAQIMYYHKWPKQGQGSHSYSCNLDGSGSYVTLSANFGQSTYDWANMLDNYGNNSPSVANAAVAKLMSDVGISVEMGYGMSSGASSPDVAAALTTYFDYDKSIRVLNRNNYGIEAWEDMIRTELNDKRPVYYSGHASSGGHAFVCDGYDTEGYFHFNWGWGGMSNGYFILSMLNPREQGIGSFEGGYNSSQLIITRIMPNEGGEPIVEPLRGVCSLKATDKSVSVGSATGINVSEITMLGTKDWSTLYWGLCVTTPDEANPTIVEYPQSWANASSISIGNSYGLRGALTFTPSTSLSPGKYHLRYLWYKDEEEIGLFGGATPSEYIIDMEIKDGKAYFTEHRDLGALSATTEINGNTIYSGLQFCVKTTVTNSGSEFYGDVTLSLEQNNAVKLQSSVFKIAVAQGKSFSFETNLTADVPAGDYDLVVRDADNNILGSTPVKVADGGGQFNLQMMGDLTPQSSEMPANDVNASVTIRNTGGVFAGQLEMYIIYESNGSYYIGQTVKSNNVVIPTNGSAVVNFHGEFAGAVGTSYYLAMQNPHTTSTSPWGSWIEFRVCEPKVDPEYEVGDVNGDGEVDITDINAIVALLLGQGNEEHKARADVNSDGDVDITDVNTLVKMQLGN